MHHWKMEVAGVSVKLVAIVEIGAGYPELPPLFILLLKWQGATRSSSDWEPLKVSTPRPQTDSQHPYILSCRNWRRP